MMNHKTLPLTMLLILALIGLAAGLAGCGRSTPEATAPTNYYYVVRSGCVGAHADDAERAEFDFSLTPGD